jgi:hypothetical protein
MEQPMSALIAQTAEIPLATVFGSAGLVAQLVGPLFRSRETMVTVQLAAACSYAASYALMGQETATAVCLTGATQSAVALLAGNRRGLGKLGYFFLPVVLSIGVLTFSGLPTLFSVAACCLVMIGRLQADTLRMRGIQLTAAPLGATHDALIGAWPGFAGACVTFAIALTAFVRERRSRLGAAHTA